MLFGGGRAGKMRRGSAEAAVVEVLAETVGENDPAIPASARYLSWATRYIRKDGRSIAVAEFTSNYLTTFQPPMALVLRGSQALRVTRIDL